MYTFFSLLSKSLDRAESSSFDEFLEKLEKEANKYISSYAVYYPQTADAFMYDVTDGQSYTVSCGGMRATTTVRTQK